jgi:hypothetical protein
LVAYSFKKRFVVPIRAGLGLDAPAIPTVRPKRQTIRAIGKRRHARPGEQLQLYQGMRTPDCFLIGRARCTTVPAVTIYLSDHDFMILIDGSDLMPSGIRDFAKDDGFEDEHDMLDFWRQNHPGIERFDGICVKWEPEP